MLAARQAIIARPGDEPGLCLFSEGTHRICRARIPRQFRNRKGGRYSNVALDDLRATVLAFAGALVLLALAFGGFLLLLEGRGRPF